MKRIFILMAAGLLAGNFTLRAQDASAVADQQAAQERYQKLAGEVQDLRDTTEAQRKEIEQLQSELKDLRDAQAKVNPDAVGHDELKQLAEKVKEIDDKRAADKELILAEIAKLGKVPTTPSGKISKHKADAMPTADSGTSPDKSADKNYDGYEYVIKDGDTLSKIVAAYREQGVKVTVDQILKHPLNAKVDANKLRVGQKIFIPATK